MRFPVPPGSTPIGTLAMGERADDLHHRSVAAERENRVVVAAALLRDLGRVPGSLGEHQIARHPAPRERRLRVRLTARASTRSWIDDE